MNLLFKELISKSAAIFSTSVVGSTPGNSTKKIGTFLVVSANISLASKAGYSIYLSPILSITKLVKADDNLSGLMALNNKSLWNLLKSLKAFGRSACSAFSS